MEPTFGLVLTNFGFGERMPMVALGQAPIAPRQGFRLRDSLRHACAVSRTGRGSFMSWRPAQILLVVGAAMAVFPTIRPPILHDPATMFRICIVIFDQRNSFDALLASMLASSLSAEPTRSFFSPFVPFLGWMAASAGALWHTLRRIEGNIKEHPWSIKQPNKSQVTTSRE